MALRRSLAEARPDAFLPELAASLNNLGVRQSELGQREAALASTLEAVSLYRRLVESHLEAVVPDLAGCLNNLALILYESGRLAEALPFADEALDILWPIYERLPEAHGDLASSVLRTMADILKALGQPPGRRLTQRMTRYLSLSNA